MKITDIKHLPLLLPHGRTAIRVVVRGSGLVVVGEQVLWSWRQLDRIITIPALGSITVRVWGDSRTLVLPVLASSPQPPVVPITNVVVATPKVGVVVDVPDVLVHGLTMPMVLPLFGGIDHNALVPGDLT
jgi:hypothetical protein